MTAQERPHSSELQLTVEVLGEKAWVSANQLFSPRPKGCALLSNQKTGWWTPGSCAISTMRKSVYTISKLVCNFEISNLRSAITKLRKFANWVEHIYPAKLTVSSTTKLTN